MLMLVRKNFFDLTPAPANIFRKNFYDLVKIIGNVGQNMTTPPPPPPMLMASRRPWPEVGLSGLTEHQH
jgi:hypothetical protein